MTLKEKIIQADKISIKHSSFANIIEKIADDYAIGFAEWLLNERTGFNRETEIKELLEIYKKEKVL